MQRFVNVAAEYNSPLGWLAFFVGLIPVCVAHRALKKLPKPTTWGGWLWRKAEFFLLWCIPLLGLVASKGSDWSFDKLSDSYNKTTNRLAVAEEKLKSIAPLNQPVSEITANATVELTGNLPGVPPLIVGIDWGNCVVLMESNHPPATLAFSGLNVLYACDITGFTTTSDGPTTHSYVMNLRRDTAHASGPVQVITDFSTATAGMVMDKINCAEMKLEHIPPKSEILGGFVEFLINGSFKKRLSIPKQVCPTNGIFWASNIALQ